MVSSTKLRLLFFFFNSDYRGRVKEFAEVGPNRAFKSLPGCDSTLKLGMNYLLMKKKKT